MKEKKISFTGVALFALALFLLPVPLLAAARSDAGNAGKPTDGAPIAQHFSVRAYCGIPYSGTLRAANDDGTPLCGTIVQEPKRGTVTLAEDGVGFTYTPSRCGSDSFSYTLTDEEGRCSAPAVIKIKTIRPPKNITYSDMEDSDAYTAAIDLAAKEVFLGECIGGHYFFEPTRTVSRSEFVAMALTAAGKEIPDVCVTGFCDDDSIPTWAKGCAVSALRSGLVKGIQTEEGVAFDSSAPISRKEAAIVLNRLLAVTDVDVNTLTSTPEEWGAQAVANLVSVNVMDYAADTEQTLNRAEAAKLLSAAMGWIAQR